MNQILAVAIVRTKGGESTGQGVTKVVLTANGDSAMFAHYGGTLSIRIMMHKVFGKDNYTLVLASKPTDSEWRELYHSTQLVVTEELSDYIRIHLPTPLVTAPHIKAYTKGASITPMYISKEQCWMWVVNKFDDTTTMNDVDIELFTRGATSKLFIVPIIPSGFEWICPICNGYNKEIEVLENVICEHCHEIITVSPQ